jgi:predicted RNA polymerase sigma factor
MKELQITSVRNGLKSSEFGASGRRFTRTRNRRRTDLPARARVRLFGKFRSGENQRRKRNHREQEQREETPAASLRPELLFVYARPAVRSGYRISLRLRVHGLILQRINARTDTLGRHLQCRSQIKSRRHSQSLK